MLPESRLLDRPSLPRAIPQDAQAAVLKLIYGRYVGQAVCVAARLGLADQIAAGTTRTDDIAAIIGADPAALRRLLRLLSAHEVVVEEAPDVWANTSAGELLRSQVRGSLGDLARFFASPEHGAAWLALEHCIRTGENGFEHAHGMTAWDFAQANPALNESFNAAMTSIAGSIHRAIAEAYDFTQIEQLVDVGGGHGRLMQCLLERFPGLRGIVFDLPHVVRGAQSLLAEHGLDDRCSVEAGDFFKSVPAGADAYIMTAVLHDWDDDACISILRNCRAAMRATGRILLGEFVLKPSNEPDFGKTVDLEMLVMTEGRERNVTEFRRLLAAAGLSLHKILTLPTGTSLIEARASNS